MKDIMIKRLLSVSVFTLVGVTVFLALSGCGDSKSTAPPIEPPIEPPVLLGQSAIDTLTIDWVYGAFVDTVPSVTYSIGYGEYGRSPQLAAIDLTSVASGDTIVIDSSVSPWFYRFVFKLTNKEDDLLYRAVRVFGNTTGGTVGGGVYESYGFNRLPNSYMFPDFGDTTVSRIEFEFDEVKLEHPGRDPNGDGKWIDVRLSGSIKFY